MKSRMLTASLLLPVLIPAAVFALCALLKGLSLPETTTALLQQFKAERQNLLVCGLIGLFPVGLLHGCLWIHRWKKGAATVERAMAIGGLVAILLVLLWVNFQFWPLFLPDRVYPGFPHGLEFIIGPGIFAPVAMIIGMAIGWIATRTKQ